MQRSGPVIARAGGRRCAAAFGLMARGSCFALALPFGFAVAPALGLASSLATADALVFRIRVVLHASPLYRLMPRLLDPFVFGMGQVALMRLPFRRARPLRFMRAQRVEVGWVRLRRLDGGPAGRSRGLIVLFLLADGASRPLVQRLPRRGFPLWRLCCRRCALLLRDPGRLRCRLLFALDPDRFDSMSRLRE